MQSEAGGLPQAGSKPGGYVPPSRRAGATMADGDSMRRREENSVRVTNLSEDTREDDLRVSCSALPFSLCALALTCLKQANDSMPVCVWLACAAAAMSRWT